MLHDTLLGESNAFLTMLEHVSALAPLNKPVLVMGERGSGKELVARRLHYLSQRWEENLVTLNCAALNENLLDSELFGHESGAFTGAQRRHVGRFERAHLGTLFLDEIGNAPLAVQEKLLRVVEYGELERVGGSVGLQVDVRLICATHANLPQQVAEGKFRADLLDRLAFDVITVPPLRERQADILPLATHFAIQMCQELTLPLFPGFSQSAEQQLIQWSWPGNIRELKNVIERSVYRAAASHKPIEQIIFNPFRETLPATPHSDSSQQLPTLPLDLRSWQWQQEARLLQISLAQHNNVQTEAARSLGLTYHQFRALLKKHQLTVNSG